MNALVVIAERLSAAQGRRFIDTELLLTAHVLIIHLGPAQIRWGAKKSAPYNWCGRAFATAPSSVDSQGEVPYVCGPPTANMDLLLDQMAALCASAPCGASTCTDAASATANSAFTCLASACSCTDAAAALPVVLPLMLALPLTSTFTDAGSNRRVDV